MYVLKEENSKELEEEGDQEDSKHNYNNVVVFIFINYKFTNKS